MKFYIALFLIITIFSIGTVHVKAVDSSLQVREDIYLHEDNSADIDMNVHITNKSETDLISSFTIDTGFGNPIIFDMFKNPIGTKSSRDEITKLHVNNFCDQLSQLRRVYLKKTTSQVPLDSLDIQLKYPGSWGEPVYTSRSPYASDKGSLNFSGNDPVYVVWGEKMTINVSSKYSIPQDADNLIPIIKDDQNQQSYYLSLSGAKSVYFDKLGNTFISANEQSLDLKSLIVINTKKDYSLDKNDKDLLKTQGMALPKVVNEKNDRLKTVQEILDKLKAEYKFTARKDVKKTARTMNGDEYDLARITVEWLRQSDIPAGLVIGWDLGLNKQPDKNGYSFWIIWLNGNEWKTTDVLKYVKGESIEFESVSPDGIILFEGIDFKNEKYKMFEHVLSKNITPVVEANTDSDLYNKLVQNNEKDLHINWLGKSGNIVRLAAKLNINNRTNQILQIKSTNVNNKQLNLQSENSYKNLSQGVLPGNYKSFDISYSKNLFNIRKENINLDTEVSYNLGSHSFRYSDKQDINNILINWNDFNVYILASLAFGVFLTLELISLIRKHSRPKS